MFGRFKDWRYLATRYERCPKVFLSDIARAEPENSILELVRVVSTLDTDVQCVALGKFDDNAITVR